MESSIHPTVVAAIIAAVVSFLVSKATLHLGRERLDREFKLEFSTEIAIGALLASGEYDMRTFDRIKAYLPGFDSDNELRRLLIRSGGVSFKRESDGAELWGLLDKHRGQAFK